MKRFILTLLLFSLAREAAATAVTCPAQDSLAGEYETFPEKGFTPNKLIVRTTSDTSYSIALSSYWAPKPFDDGTLGTVGDFSGDLFIPQPWSCVAVLEISEETKDEETNRIVCFLLLRFVDASSINVSTLGQCEYFHGQRATPAGSYTRRKS